MRRGSYRICPHQQPLRSRPDTVNHAPRPVFAHQVAISVAQKAAGAAAEFHQPIAAAAWLGSLLFANVSLMVRHAHMLRPVLGGDFYRHFGCDGDFLHRFVHAFSVHVDFDRATGSCHAVEDGLPEIVAAFFHPAFSVNPEGYPADCGTSAQQHAYSIATVGTVILLGDTLNRIVRVFGVDPFIAVHPKTELKIDAASYCLLGDEL